VTVIVRLDCLIVTVCIGGIRHIITVIQSKSVLYFRICHIKLKFVAFTGIIVEWWVGRVGSLREHHGLGWV